MNYMIDKKYQVTFLISSLGGGGAEGVCVTLANGLAELGWDVKLVVLHEHGSVYHERLSKNVSLIVLGVDNARYAALALLKYIRREQPNKILVFNYELAVILVLLRSLLFIKTKVIARNINTFSQNTTHGKGFWLQYIVKPLISHFYCKVDKIVNQCEAMRDDLLLVYPQLADRLSVIHNPVASHIEAYGNTVNFDKIEKQDYLLCVGRLEKQKAFHFAIQAFAKLADKHPSLRLKIIGQGSLGPSLKELAIDLNVSERVDFEGFQKNTIPYYLHAKATLLTSLYEGFPNVLIESITLGTPVVAFDCKSGPSEIIINKCNGFIADYMSSHSLTEKIDLLLKAELKPYDVHMTSKIYSKNHIVKQWLEI